MSHAATPSAADKLADTPTDPLLERLDALRSVRPLVHEVVSEGNDEALATSIAGNFISMVIDLAADFCGDDILNAAFRAGAHGDPLMMIAQRMRLVEPLFNRTPGDTLFSELGIECVTVSQGDAPRLFARSGKGAENTFRLACFRLEALKWSRYFAGAKVRGSGAAGWKARIEDAFGVEWESIRKKWPAMCISAFGQEQFDRSLKLAFDLGRCENPTEIDRWNADLRYSSVEEAGAAFRKENGGPN